MKKRYVSLIIIAVLILAVWGVVGYSHASGESAKVSDLTGNVISNFEGDKREVIMESSYLEFEGYKVGGSHVGTFEDMEANVYVEGGKVKGIEGVAQVSSVKTDTAAVDKHLQNDDFFDVEKYPEIKFTSTNVDYENSEITGILEFHGESKEITFPAEFSQSGILADFYLDSKPFNFKFTGVNPEVRIKFAFNY